MSWHWILYFVSMGFAVVAICAAFLNAEDVWMAAAITACLAAVIGGVVQIGNSGPKPLTPEEAAIVDAKYQAREKERCATDAAPFSVTISTIITHHCFIQTRDGGVTKLW